MNSRTLQDWFWEYCFLSKEFWSSYEFATKKLHCGIMFKIKKFQICLGSGQQNLKFVYIKQKLACFRWVHFCFLVYKWTKQHLLWSFFLWSVHNFQQILFANLEHSGNVTFWSLWLWPLKKKLEKVNCTCGIPFLLRKLQYLVPEEGTKYRNVSYTHYIHT